MSKDIYIRFPEGKLPTKDQLKTVLEDYLSSIALSVEWDEVNDCLYAQLPGACKHPLARILPKETRKPAEVFEADPHGRWFEVRAYETTVVVTTRQHDHVTNTLAKGYAAIIALYWQGRLGG